MGETLTAQVADQDGVDPSKVKYQWLADGKEISGATNSTFTLTEAQKGAKITVKATYTDNANHAEDITSSATDAVTDGNIPPPVTNHEGTVAISGNAKVGETLTAQVADQDGVDPSKVKYQWLADGKEISGATTDSYTLKAEDTGHKISVKATYTDNANHAENLTSSESDTVVDPANQPGSVTISGEAKLDQTLTAEVHDGDGVPEKVSYQWFADGKPIDGATDKTFKLTTNELGSRITVQATYDDNAKHHESPTSAPTAQVSNDQPTFPAPTLEKGTGAEQGGVTITPPEGATYLHIGFQYHGQMKEITLVRDNSSSPWYTRDELPGGATLDATSGKVKLAPAIVDDNSTVSAVAGVGSRYSDTASIQSDPDSGQVNPTTPEVSLAGDDKVVEGQPASYTLRLSKPAEADITVKVSIQHGTTDDGNVKAEERTVTIAKGQTGATLTVETLDNNTFQPDRNYRVEITEAQGATVKDGGKTVETTISDNDPPSVPQMAAGSEPGSIDITPVAGTKTLTVNYPDEAGAAQTVKATRNDRGEWVSEELPEGVKLDAQSGKITLGAKAVQDGGKVSAHNDSEFAEGVVGELNAGNNDGTNPPPPVQPNHEGTVTVTGDAKVGGTLTATVADEDGVPSEGVKYQWMRNGEAIDGATEGKYTLTAADAGQQITVKATYEDNAHHAESPVSSGTEVPKDNTPPTADFHDDFSAYPAGSDFAQGSTFGEWRVIQSGYGHVKVVDDGNGNNVLELKPKVQSGESATSSTEVIGPEHGSDFTFSGTISTPEQLRQGAAPHAWETGWLVWNYTDNDHFYYFVPRANGWELGKRDPAYKGGQRFIASGNESWPLADAKEFSISKHGNTVEIKINGKVVTTITDDSDAYSGNGRVGIYSEDARVHADNISLSKQANIEGKANHAGSVSIQADNTGTLHATINDGDNVDNSKPVSYQWYAGNDAIAGATGADYTPTGQATGITVRATYTDGNGHVESIVSPLASASNGGSNHPGSVTIEGEAREGTMLTAHVSDADGVDANAIQYTWLRDGNPINFVKGNTYTLTGEDVGHQISVQAYYHDKAGHEENNVISAKTAAVVDAAADIPPQPPTENHAPTGAVTISGLAQAGSTLHAGNTLADEDGMGEVKYQWLRDGKAIDGATGSAYTLTAEDVGHGISVKASYTDQKAHDESKDSLSSLKPAADGTAPSYNYDYDQSTMDWAGFKWVARGDGFKEGGPQANHKWSKANAHLDGTNMDLSITNADGHTPVASEIVSTRAMGYGTYEATFKADFSKFDKYSVFGFFTFDWSQDKVDDGYREIDAVEISRWGDSVLKGTTTYYPYTSEKGVHPQPDSVWPENWTHGTVKLEWTPQKISWTLRNADTGEQVTKDITSDIVKPDNQQMHFNLWTYKPQHDSKQDGWQDSAKDAEQKVTLESFSYTPLADDGSNHSNTPAPHGNGNQPTPQPPSGENHKGAVTLSGEAKIGHTLTAQLTDADGVPESGITWRWYGNDKLLPEQHGQTINLDNAVKGMQLRAEAEYTDKAGHAEKPVSDLSPAVVPEAANSGDLIPPPAADAPRVTLSGQTSVLEGKQATYTVSLDQPASEDVSVDVRIKHGSTDASDANLTWNIQRVVIPKGSVSKDFTVDTHDGDGSEGTETYTVEIANALVGNINAGDKPFTGTVSAQSMIIPAYKYPTGGWETDTYWDSVHKAGGGKVPYAVINPASGVGEKANSDYVKLINDNDAVGIKNLGYIRTVYQTRPIEEVKAEVDKYLEFYGKDKIHGYFFDEISAQSNHATAYMAELYRYVKEKAGNKLVMANPGTHITDAIAPYADIFVTSEVSAKTYLNNYEQPKSAFENDPANAHRIMHMIHDVTPDQYDAVIKASRERNAGWVFPTSDTQENPLPEDQREKHPEQDGNPYNALPQNFEQLVASVNNLGQPADPTQHGTPGKLTAANIGNDNVTTEIVEDTPSGNLEQHETPQAVHDDAALASASDGAEAAHPHDSTTHQHGGDGHDVLVSDGIDTAAWSGLMNLDGADLLNYLGEYSSELLAASKTASSHALHGGAGDDTLVAGHGAALLEGGAGADTFAYLLDSHDAASWQQPGKILDFNPHEGDRIVLAGDEHLAHAKLEVSEDASGQHLHVTDDAGHTRSIDIASQGGKPLSAEDILSHVDIAAPKAYEPSAYSAPQTHHLPQEDHSHLI